MEKYAVIVAGGSGSRMGSPIPKQFLLLQDKPVLWHTLTAFLDSFPDMQIILVLPELHLDAGHAIAHSTRDPSRISLAKGGATRFHSVKNGLDKVHNDAVVFIHDGVRCLLTPGLIRRCYDAAIDKGNAIPAIKSVDAVRIETPGGNESIDKNKVHIIQTPQTFLSGIIKRAFQQEYQDHFTDEAAVAEQMGIGIHLIEGEDNNIKITKPVDLFIAEKILESRRS